MTHTLTETITFGYGDTIVTEELHFEEVKDLKNRKEVPREAGVYIVYGKNDTVLYIGETKNLRNRIGEHVRGHRLSSRFYKDIVTIKYAHTDFDRFTRDVAEGLMLLKYLYITVLT